MKLIDEKQAAAMLNCSVVTLQKKRQQGTGPHYYRLGSRIIRYSVEGLLEYLEQNKRTSTSQY